MWLVNTSDSQKGIGFKVVNWLWKPEHHYWAWWEWSCHSSESREHNVVIEEWMDWKLWNIDKLLLLGFKKKEKKQGERKKKREETIDGKMTYKKDRRCIKVTFGSFMMKRATAHPLRLTESNWSNEYRVNTCGQHKKVWGTLRLEIVTRTSIGGKAQENEENFQELLK